MLRGTPLSPTLQEMPSQGETGGSWVGGGGPLQGRGILKRAGAPRTEPRKECSQPRRGQHRRQGKNYKTRLLCCNTHSSVWS